MKNKKAQIFEIYLMVLTIVMCALVVFLYFIQQDNSKNSLLSPKAVFEIRDKLEIFELKEKELVMESLNEAKMINSFESREFPGKFKEIFLNKIDSEMEEFIFSGLVHEKEARKNGQIFLESIYFTETSPQKEEIIFTRANIEKRFYLKSEMKNKINFPVEFSFVMGKQYLITFKEDKFYLEE
jgi:hypothetical protein